MSAVNLSNDIPVVDLPLPSEKSEQNDRVIGVCTSGEPEFVLEQALKGGVHHIVQKDGLAFAQEIELAKLMIEFPQKFANFPISSILTPKMAGLEAEAKLTRARIKCSSNAERDESVQAIMNSLGKDINTGVLVELEVAITELVSNAVSHGPQTEHAKLKYDKQGHEFENSQRVHIRPSFISVGSDEERIAVVCLDLYGELKILEMLERVRRCFEFGVGSMINFGDGGAGIGTFMLFKRSVGIYLSVNEGGQTIVAATFAKTGSEIRRNSIPKNLHIHAGKKNR